MCSISQAINRCEHSLNTRYHACRLYSSGNFTQGQVARRYKTSVSSIRRWMKRFDGTRESLKTRSKRPKTPHPNAHTAEEVRHIEDLRRRHPKIGLSELYGKLKKKYAYTRNPASLFRFLRKRGIYMPKEHKKTSRPPKKYETPKEPGIKMQLDVKYVPKACYAGKDSQKFYQYTIIDECTRERFLYAFEEKSSHTTILFLKRAFIYFGYLPKIIQTDHGVEFTHLRNTDMVHPMKRFCNALGIEHKTIRPYTPRHNGKVERSHRNDNVRFYSQMSFYNLDDLNHQMKAYLKRSNDIPSSSINWLSPVEKRATFEKKKRNVKRLFSWLRL